MQGSVKGRGEVNNREQTEAEQTLSIPLTMWYNYYFLLEIAGKVLNCKAEEQNLKKMRECKQ